MDKQSKRMDAYMSERRDAYIMAAMRGLLAGIQWTPGLLVHEDALASDAVAIADAVIKEADKAP